MIMRIWKGSTHRSDSDSYYEYLQETGVKEYRKTTGNHGVYVLRRNVERPIRISLALSLGLCRVY